MCPLQGSILNLYVPGRSNGPPHPPIIWPYAYAPRAIMAHSKTLAEGITPRGSLWPPQGHILGSLPMSNVQCPLPNGHSCVLRRTATKHNTQYIIHNT